MLAMGLRKRNDLRRRAVKDEEPDIIRILANCIKGHER